MNRRPIAWAWYALDDLSARQLYRIISLRERVFVVEQECIYLDADGLDIDSCHLCGWDGETVVAYLRLMPPGVKYPEAAIGRVVIAPERRGEGLAKALMREAIRESERRFPGVDLKLSGQCYLEGFYSDLGFQSRGEPYLEDGIPHITMTRSAGVAQSPE
ncbi:GNAT family N-acetyltransferase [Sulfidibacter corallicola]|uniref:GNAT family N-acetyltransferase n=1 Tax=Sulfidibacter corallicola TaxID=2818388 RepID=A0A8A4TTG2_SULCO|nr:GNAT family N-acetyltransferase [Sulfidibacter corallicola]QTD53249.1 GNAT family N-acetyltransferase [Sulfidibacter corallicola]